MKMEGVRSVNVLDIVDVPLIASANDSIHPEDWIIDPTRPWKRGRFDANNLGLLEEQPADLWLGVNGPPGSGEWELPFEAAELPIPRFNSARPIHAWSCPTSTAHSLNRKQKKTRLKFIYRRQEYGLNLTDPVFAVRHGIAFPRPEQKASTIDLPCGDNCLLCVSVTPECNDGHLYENCRHDLGVAVMRFAAAKPSLFTIGHSNHEMTAFVSLLSGADGVNAIADVRSHPYSRFHGQFNRETLANVLEARRDPVRLSWPGTWARRTEPESYQENQARYELVSELPAFREGLERVRRGLASHRIALMCAVERPDHLP